MQVAAFLSIITGLFAGTWLSWQATRVVLKRLSSGGVSPRVIQAFIFGGLLLGAVPAVFLAYVVGGTFGGAYGAAVSEPFGTLAGLAVGISLVLVVCTVCVAVVSGLLGAAIASFSRARHVP